MFPTLKVTEQFLTAAKLILMITYFIFFKSEYLSLVALFKSDTPLYVPMYLCILIDSRNNQ